MLDSRASHVPTQVGEPGAARAKGARLLDGLTARPSAPGDLTFDSVLSDAMAERSTILRPHRNAARAGSQAASCPSAPSRHAVPRKHERREPGSDSVDEAPGDRGQAEGQPPSHQASASAADTPPPIAALQSEPPPASDVQAAGAPDDVVTDAAREATTTFTGGTVWHTMSATMSMPTSNVAAAAAMVPDAADQAGTPDQTVQVPAVAGVYPEPLEPTAQQQAAEANGTAGPPQIPRPVGPAAAGEVAAEVAAKSATGADAEVVAEPSAEATGSPGSQFVGDRSAKVAAGTPRASAGLVPIVAAGAVARPDGKAGEQSDPQADPGNGREPGQPAVTDLPRTTRHASNAPGFPQLPQQNAVDRPGSHPAQPSGATPGDQRADGRSATADPAGLQVRSDPVAVGAMGAGGDAPTSAHTVTAAPSDARPDIVTFAGADDGAARNMHRLATVVYAAVGRQQSVARMQLQPPELGAVTALLHLRQNRMDLKLEVASESARDLVVGGLDRLRDVLQQHGISLDRAAVSVAPRNEHAAGGQQQSAWDGQQGHASGQFDPGQGHQPDERSGAAWQAADLPGDTAAAEAEEAVVTMPYPTGLNVLA
jgi:hypothetical protein